MTNIVEPAESATGFAVRLAAKLPKSDAHNGLAGIAGHLAKAPRMIRVAVIAYDVARVIDDIDSATDTAVVRILRVEPIDGKNADTARKLLLSANGGRTGQTLPLADFDDWASETGDE